MKPTHTSATKASWTFKIFPYFDQERYLVEEAPLNEDTRAIWQLKEPVRNFLATHAYKLEIDRGDFGEGAEHFYVKLFSETDAKEFEALCESLKHS